MSKCLHAHRLGPYHTPCAARVWYYCQDCGRFGSRYTRTERFPKTPMRWGFLVDPVRDCPLMSPGLPFEEFR